MINAVYEAGRIELTQGEVEGLAVPSPSGKGQIIARCPACRVAIWSNYDFGGLRERMRFLRVGTLDDPSLMPPDIHIFTSTKLPWYVIPPDQKSVDEYYDARDVWSAESQARFKKLKESV